MEYRKLWVFCLHLVVWLRVWIPNKAKQYSGKRFVCKPFLPADIQGSTELHVYIHEDIQGIAEVRRKLYNMIINYHPFSAQKTSPKV